MDTRRLLIAAILSLGIMIAWGTSFLHRSHRRPAELPPATVAESGVEPVPVSPPPQEAAAPESAPPVSPKEVPETPPEVVSGELEIIAGVAEERVVITGDTFRAEFTSRGAQLVSFQTSRTRELGWWAGGPGPGASDRSVSLRVCHP